MGEGACTESMPPPSTPRLKARRVVLRTQTLHPPLSTASEPARHSFSHSPKRCHRLPFTPANRAAQQKLLLLHHHLIPKTTETCHRRSLVPTHLRTFPKPAPLLPPPCFSSSNLLKLVELRGLPVIPSPPFKEAQLAPLDRLASVRPHSLELLSDGDEVVTAPLDPVLEHSHLPPVQPLRAVDEGLHVFVPPRPNRVTDRPAKSSEYQRHHTRGTKERGDRSEGRQNGHGERGATQRCVRVSQKEGSFLHYKQQQPCTRTSSKLVPVSAHSEQTRWYRPRQHVYSTLFLHLVYIPKVQQAIGWPSTTAGAPSVPSARFSRFPVLSTQSSPLPGCCRSGCRRAQAPRRTRTRSTPRTTSKPSRTPGRTAAGRGEARRGKGRKGKTRAGRISVGSRVMIAPPRVGGRQTRGGVR